MFSITSCAYILLLTAISGSHVLNLAKEDERGQHEPGPLMEGEVKKKVPSATGVDGLSEEAVPFQEIADILFLLKQR